MRLLLSLALIAVACEAWAIYGGPGSMVAPPAGTLYHGVYPGGTSGWEDDITAGQVTSYQQAVGKQVAWVYFSNNWFAGTAFPTATATWIREMGAVPYIRLMLREEEDGVPNRFSIEEVLAGHLDGELHAWMRGAREFGTALIVEFGTECNGDWFPWNGAYHGGGTLDGFGDPTKPDGPERFVRAYRRIALIARAEHARNITWVFHINATGWPLAAWNRFENYYPGNAFVHWIGVSAYGPQAPTDTEYESFRAQMDACYQRIVTMAPSKPIFVAEFGATAGSPLIAPEVWAGAALDDILGGRWPKLMGFSWWNEHWQNDDDPAHDSDMRVEDAPALAAVFRAKLAAAGEKVVERPMTR
ncbi:MAG: glycosyl hydrolase [Armatimonadota bacterium]